MSMYGDKTNKLIERFIEFKNKKGLTEKQLSKISGVSLDRVKGMLNGEIKHPTFYEIVNVAVALEIPTCKGEPIIDADLWNKAMCNINSGENMIYNQKLECCDCYIGVYWDYENSELMTRKDLEELINSASSHACTREQYCDRNFYTGLEKFVFCPKCGKEIDWDAIRENR